ncbi:MAG: hypothetical protein NXI22_26390 [bacterium]|nr:hypothetical protein [bacterium]
MQDALHDLIMKITTGSTGVIWGIGIALTVLMVLAALGFRDYQKKNNIPYPTPSTWPQPLPKGWRYFFIYRIAFFVIFGLMLCVFGLQGYRWLAEVEASRESFELHVVAAMIYKLAGKAGVLAGALLIAIASWFTAGILAWKLRTHIAEGKNVHPHK